MTPRSSRSPIAWTRSSAASPSGSSRAAPPIRSACAAPRSASGRSCSTRGWREARSRRDRRDRAIGSSRRRASTLDGCRTQLDEFFARACAASSSTRASRRRTPTPRSRRTSRDPVDARARALACANDAEGSARGVQARREHPRRRARQEARRSAAAPRPGEVRVADVETNLYAAIQTAQATAKLRAATSRDYRAVFDVAREAAPDGRRVLRQGRRHGHGSRPSASRQPARAAQLVHRARIMQIADFRLLAGAVVKYVRQFGGGSAEGRSQGQGAARRQGREPRRDGVARAAGAARLHDHDRGLPPRHGARRGQLSGRARRRGRDRRSRASRS